MAKREAPTATNLGRMIRLYRRMHEIAIKPLAEDIGIAAGTLLRFEKGHGVDDVVLMKIFNWAMLRPVNPPERLVD